MEESIETFHLEENLPATGAVALSEAGYFVLLLGSSLLPAIAAPFYKDKEKNWPVLVQAISIVFMNIAMYYGDKKLFEKPLEKIRQAAAQVDIEELLEQDQYREQRAAYRSQFITSWYKRGLSNTEILHLDSAQISNISNRNIVKRFLRTKLLTKDQALGLTRVHLDVFNDQGFKRLVKAPITSEDNRKLYRSVAEVRAEDICIENLREPNITIAVRNEVISMGIALQLKKYHFPALSRNSNYYEAIKNHKLSAKDFLRMKEEDLYINTAPSNIQTNIPRL